MCAARRATPQPAILLSRVVWRVALDSEELALLALRLLVDGKASCELDVLELEALAEGPACLPASRTVTAGSVHVSQSMVTFPPCTSPTPGCSSRSPLWAGISRIPDLPSVTRLHDMFPTAPRRRDARGVDVGYGKATSVFDAPIPVRSRQPGSRRRRRRRPLPPQASSISRRSKRRDSRLHLVWTTAGWSTVVYGSTIELRAGRRAQSQAVRIAMIYR